MSASPDLSVLIISHGHEAMLPGCVRSLLPALEGLSFEIVAVDNLAQGRLPAALAGLPVAVVSNPRPLGFAANVNKATRRTRGRHLLLLNPDTVHERGGLAGAIGFLQDHPAVGILGCTLLNADSSPQQSFRQFPSLAVLLARGLGADRWPWRPAFYRRRMMEDVAPAEPHPVDWVFGAFMLMRRADFDRLGGMDDNFRLYYEDVDLCFRHRRAGRATWVYPTLAFTHAHLRHSAKTPFSEAWRWHVRSATRYFWKSWRASSQIRLP